MVSPFDAGRDSNAASGNAFDREADVADAHQAMFQQSFLPSAGKPVDNLDEVDYRRGTDAPPDPGYRNEPRTNDAEQYDPTTSRQNVPSRFTYPFIRGEGGRLADDV